MKKFLLLLFDLILVQANAALATHLKGGEITYTRDAGNQLKYTFKVTIYTDATGGQQANDVQDEIMVYFGDGVQATASRTNGKGTNLGDNTKVNYYTIDHVFPAAGSFKMFVNLQNRNSGTINIGPEPSNLSFYLESMLVINAGLVNNSVTFSDKPIFNCQVGQTYRQNIIAMDPDGDSLSFRLVPSKYSNNPKTGVGSDIPGYEFPDSISIHPISGELLWKKPIYAGQYNFAVEVAEWRNGIKISQTLRDYQVVAMESPNQAPRAQLLDSQQKALKSSSAMKFEEGEVIELKVLMDNKDAQAVDVKAYSELFDLANPPSFITYDSLDFKVGKLRWQLASKDKRAQPYIITFRGTFTSKNNFLIGATDLTALVYAGRDIPIPSITTGVEEELSSKVEMFPNPTKDVVSFNLPKLEKQVRLVLFDRMGKEVGTWLVTNKAQFQINLSYLTAGLYTYQLSDGTKVISNGRLVRD